MEHLKPDNQDTKFSDSAECRQAPGVFAPVIDRNRCEGKAVCFEVCPTDVFVIGLLSEDQRHKLSWKGRIKGWAHGWKQAFTPNASACEACAKCVESCPEGAIQLERSLHNSSAKAISG